MRGAARFIVAIVAASSLTPAQAKTLAIAINLVPSDVPGFGVTPLEQPAPGGGGCGSGASPEPALATGVSDAFTRTVGDDAEEVNSTVKVWPASSDARRVLASLEGRRGHRCVMADSERGTPAGTTASLTRLAAAPEGGVGLRVALHVAGSTEYIDLLAFAQGPTDVMLSLVYEAKRPTATLERQLMAELQARAATALAAPPAV